jgi:hypothetical protein
LLLGLFTALSTERAADTRSSQGEDPAAYRPIDAQRRSSAGDG